jgi:methionine-rich copper-binding protein CopC
MKPSDRVRRTLVAIGVALALSAAPAVALGHVSLESSSPEAGESLETAPTEVTLTFDGELDPAGSTFSVVDHDGAEVGSGEVDLDVADRNVMTGSVDISEPGVYTVEWEVLGADGHEITGAFSFGYATDEVIPGPTGDDGHESPDTAMGDDSVDPLTLAGMALMALAGLAAVRRVAVR